MVVAVTVTEILRIKIDMRPTLLLWIFSWLGSALSARILVYLPSISPSHHFVYRPVLRALANRGHHITYVSGVEWKDPPGNVDQRYLNLSLTEFMKNPKMTEWTTDTPMEKMVKSFSPLAMTKMYNDIFQVVLEASFKNSVTQDLINSDEKYDLLMSEAMRGMEGIAAFQHRFNATGVIFQTRGDNAWANELTGLPDNPAYMVDAKIGYSEQMDFWERLNNLYFNVVSHWLSYRNLQGHQTLVDKYLRYDGWESRPPLSLLISDQALVLSNSHLSAGYAYPKAPNFKEVGGTNVPEPKPLPEEMEKRLNNTSGLIYFSMGSNMDLNNPTMRPENLRRLFLTVFAQRKETVFWKMSGKVKEKASENIYISKWFPQVDVLAHDQTKLFISHGGMLSVMESVSQGVPIIGIPVFGDQRKNVLQAVNAGYGILLDVWNLTESSLDWAINEMMSNPSYRENAAKRSRIFHDRPMKPVDEAVYWIEYVLRNGKVLQPASAHLPFYQVYLLDVFGLVLSVAAIVVVLLKKISAMTLTGISKNQTNKQKLT